MLFNSQRAPWRSSHIILHSEDERAERVQRGDVGDVGDASGSRPRGSRGRPWVKPAGRDCGLDHLSGSALMR